MHRSRLCGVGLVVGFFLLVAPETTTGEEPRNPESARVMAFTGGFTSTLVKKWRDGTWSDLGDVPDGGVWSISLVVFDDGFEFGDPSQWSSQVP